MRGSRSHLGSGAVAALTPVQTLGSNAARGVVGDTWDTMDPWSRASGASHSDESLAVDGCRT